MIEQPSSIEQVLLEQTSTDMFESWDNGVTLGIDGWVKLMVYVKLRG